MSLNLTSLYPGDKDINISLDSHIDIEFDSNIDPFTIANGITIFSNSNVKWTGSMMAELDTGNSDVMDPFSGINVIEYSYSMSGGRNVTIVPTKPLKQNTQYFIQITPGNDPTRFLSKSTVGEAIYSQAMSGISIDSTYTGKRDGIYTIAFTSANNIDVSFNNVYIDSYTIEPDVKFLLNNNIFITIPSGYQSGDIIELPVYKAVGLSGLFKAYFTTSEYTTSTLKSIKIEDKLYKQIISDLKIVSTIPSCLSINNTRINPIIIKFNKNISAIQDIASKVRVFKLNLESGSSKKINYYYKISNDTLKIYMVNVDSMSEISDIPIFESAMETYSINSEYKLIML